MTGRKSRTRFSGCMNQVFCALRLLEGASGRVLPDPQRRVGAMCGKFRLSRSKEPDDRFDTEEELN